MSSELSAIFMQAMRVLFLVAVPVIVVGFVAAVIASALQSATTIQDTVIGYSAKLIGVVVLFVVFMPVAVGLFTALAETAWR